MERKGNAVFVRSATATLLSSAIADHNPAHLQPNRGQKSLLGLRDGIRQHGGVYPQKDGSLCSGSIGFICVLDMTMLPPRIVAPPDCHAGGTSMDMEEDKHWTMAEFAVALSLLLHLSLASYRLFVVEHASQQSASKIACSLLGRHLTRTSSKCRRTVLT